MIKSVVFDLDDTLISEKEYIISGYKHISSILSNEFKKSNKEIFKVLVELFNASSKNVFNRIYDKYDINYTKKDILILVDEYRNHFPEISFYEDVLPCINYLKSINMKMGIITDGYAVAQRQKLEAVNAYDYFKHIIVTDELGREYWKPHPKAFELIREKLEVDFEEMIYIGDNPEKDFYISKTYPIKTIRINRGGVHKDKKYLENIKEIRSIEKLYEL